MGKSKEEIEYTHVLNKLKREFEERWKYKTLIKTSMDDFERFRTLGTGAFGRVVNFEKMRNIIIVISIAYLFSFR